MSSLTDDHGYAIPDGTDASSFSSRWWPDNRQGYGDRGQGHHGLPFAASKAAHHAMECLNVSERREMLTEFCGTIEQREGPGHMGLMMFLAADTDPGIRSAAALSLAVLDDPSQEGLTAER